MNKYNFTIGRTVFNDYGGFTDISCDCGFQTSINLTKNGMEYRCPECLRLQFLERDNLTK